MRFGWSAWAAIAMAVAGAAMVGCSGADAPLGGPYGGTATQTPSPSGGSGNTNTTDGTNATGDTGSSSGGGSTSSSSSSGGSNSSSSSGSSGGNTSSGGSTSSSGGTSSGGTSSGGTSSSSSGSGSSSGSSGSSSGAGSSSSSGGSSSGGTAAPTWTTIYNNYMASGTEGNCTGCHGQMSSAHNGYSWLQSKGYIGGSSPALTDPNQSCLSWYGGNMPPSGPSDQKAVTDMNAWATAGAQDN